MNTTERLFRFAQEYRARQAQGTNSDWPAEQIQVERVKVWSYERELSHCHVLSESAAMREAKQRGLRVEGDKS